MLMPILTNREKQQQQRTLRRQDKKMKELLTAVEEERKQADQFKQMVCCHWSIDVYGEDRILYKVFVMLLILFAGRQECCKGPQL